MESQDIFGSQLEMDAAQGEFERLSQLCDRDSPSPTPVLAPPNQPARSPSPLAGPAAPQPVLVPTVRIRRPRVQAELNRVNTMMQHLSAARDSLLAADSADIPTPVHQHWPQTACKHEAAGRACPYIHDRTYARGRRHKLQASLQDKIARSHAALDSRPRRR